MVNPDTLHDVETSLFAVDSCIFKSGKNLKHIVNSIQQNLLEISKWCDLWGFKINTSKTIAVVFTHRSCEQIKLTLHNKQLQVDKIAKFLGLIFDSKLTWSEHIKYIEGFLGFNVHNAEHRYIIWPTTKKHTWKYLSANSLFIQCAKLPDLKVIDGWAKKT